METVTTLGDCKSPFRSQRIANPLERRTERQEQTTNYIIMKKYMVLAVLLLTALSIKAQQGEIIYVDFEPDWVCQHSKDTLWIDFDGDGSRDLLFYETGFGIQATPVLMCRNGWEIIELNNEDTIPPYPTMQELEGIWTAGSYFELPGTYVPTSSLKWGTRHRVEEQYYYGWFKVSDFILTIYAISLDKYAYCTIPDYPLHWGQTELLAVEEYDESATFATLYPNPTNGLITISGENLHQAEVINMLGQQVLSVQDKGNELQIDMATLPAGIYFVTVTDKEGRKCVRKVVKE